MLANPLINAANTLCISHTISNAGDHIIMPTLLEFTTPWLELVGGRDPHQGAKNLWKSMVAPQTVPGYSQVRWWSKAEIWFVMAENFSRLQPFVRLLLDRAIGDATTTKMANLLRDRSAALQLELAAILDVRVLVRTTYALEGDRLEILLVYRRIEELRALGRAIAANQDCPSKWMPTYESANSLVSKLISRSSTRGMYVFARCELSVRDMPVRTRRGLNLSTRAKGVPVLRNVSTHR
jgi:hypothetical protein